MAFSCINKECFGWKNGCLLVLGTFITYRREGWVRIKMGKFFASAQVGPAVLAELLRGP